MKIYLVQDTCKCPGRVYCCMANSEDAYKMALMISEKANTDCEVISRTLFYGQPPNQGFNL